ncbi:hypothetical protein [Actinomadura decatromicini]|uniref:Uncharacterized protein n=1 Tax=Actinomadura decatromicini TaxID=2604572 RepID=A0A5D3FYH6_9ACTN|nr:hypothetical protein [Actinomadura decatromicini]TYK53069.1 hypothetical protein FXF68_04900 [Actinomadura decatromicini]
MAVGDKITISLAVSRSTAGGWLRDEDRYAQGSQGLADKWGSDDLSMRASAQQHRDVADQLAFQLGDLSDLIEQLRRHIATARREIDKVEQRDDSEYRQRLAEDLPNMVADLERLQLRQRAYEARPDVPPQDDV